MHIPYQVQRLGRRYVIKYTGADGKPKRRLLDAPDRAGAEAEARDLFRRGQQRAWTVAAIVESYIDAREAAEIASTKRQRDAWKAMRSY